MPKIFEAVKGLVFLSPVVIGPYLGATAVAEHFDDGYSQEKVEELTVGIAEVDKKARQIIGEENQCQIHIYDFLRADDQFPATHEKIEETLSKTCPELQGAKDDTYRLLESYMGDISSFNAQLADQRDKQYVSGYERLGYGYFGLLAGLATAWGLSELDKAAKEKFKKPAKEPEEPTSTVQ